ncbi:RNA pseudouridylate synthase domain-containing protein 1-like [Bombyx mandarina]|nr:RNA pseudouridylate synthase domain-containing protein 1 isoform X3 [Bombyx mori]XP_028031400.1 RNA pseudouridylate synthase domain-containing protein 1-like [Bombyx mandarina]
MNAPNFNFRGFRMSTKNMAVEILFENSDYLIVNKPYDMYINSDDENEKNTVAYQIARCDSHLSTSSQPLHFVQRLDYATSGVLCMAKSRPAAASAGKAFEKRLTRKYYLAIVRGHVGFELADVDYGVGADPETLHSNHKMLARTSSSQTIQVRSAQTRMLLLETGWYQRSPVSVLLLKPITGRRHQLRVHCNAIGHTILGDYTYSDRSDCSPHRMFLHASRLVLPVDKEVIDVQTKTPYFSDEGFLQHWKSDRVAYPYKTKGDFNDVCDVIDKSYVLGVNYKMYNCTN